MVPLIPNLRERIKGKFDAAVAQGLVFCNGYTVEEVDGECFKFSMFTAHGLSKKTCFWTSDSPEPKPATGLIAPSILRHVHIRPSLTRPNSNASNLIPNLTTYIQLKVIMPSTQGDGFHDIPKSYLPSTGVSVITPPPRRLSHDPFLSPEPGLIVGPIGPAHTLLLNKYCVLPRQLLLITKEFQPQEGELRKEDWRALVDLLVQLRISRTTTATARPPDNLIFFNCGRNSGASQAHRHLQIVEWPQSVSSEKDKRARWFPEEVAMHLGSITPYNHPKVPFAHFILPLPQIPTIATEPRRSSSYHQILYQTYLTLLSYVQRSIAIYNVQNSMDLPVHYNMIMTSAFMMLVPRIRGYCEGPKACPQVWVNSVGMLGVVWVKDREEARGWKEVGCENVLKAVGIPR
ncbi:hypothetical protein EV426DRAFT_561657, partial [Tirmania nivea]